MTERIRRTWRHAPRWIKWCAAMALMVCLGVGVTWALDTDNDGMSDEFESFFGLNPFTDDAALDPDGDTLDNLAEAILFSDPFKAALATR